MNNAGISLAKETTEVTAEDFSNLMCNNFESGYHLCQLGHPLLKASGNGNIVFISAVASLVAIPLLSLYSSTKGMVHFYFHFLFCFCWKSNKNKTWFQEFHIFLSKFHFRSDESTDKELGMRVGKGQYTREFNCARGYQNPTP